MKKDRVLISVAETYDVLVRPPGPCAYELRATAHDGSAWASIWIGSGEKHFAPNVPHANLYNSMGKLKFENIFALTPGGTMGMPNREVADIGSRKPLTMDGMGGRPGTAYKDLRSVRQTALSTHGPVREVRLTLEGDMEHYVWSLNGKTLYSSDSIKIRKGETVRFIMINRSMMHHPMHLHGHFFRVINGQGDYAPLKHTVDVPPMQTTVIEFAADEVGDWFFHCHLLYHLNSGMARVVHYDGFKPYPDTAAVRGKLYRDPYYFWGTADVMNNMTQGYLELANTRNIFNLEWEAGWNNVPGTEVETTTLYERYFNRCGCSNSSPTNSAHSRTGLFGSRRMLNRPKSRAPDHSSSCIAGKTFRSRQRPAGSG